MSEIIKQLPKQFNDHFNPWRKNSYVDYPESSCIGLMTGGMSVVLSVITTLAIADSVRLKNAVCLTGVSCITAGLTGKKGYVILPAALWLLAGISILTRPAGLKISDFYTRNIKHMTQNSLCRNNSKAIKN